MQKTIANDNFYNKIIKLVIPIVIQNLLSAAVSSADVVMLNYVGQSRSEEHTSELQSQR